MSQILRCLSGNREPRPIPMFEKMFPTLPSATAPPALVDVRPLPFGRSGLLKAWWHFRVVLILGLKLEVEGCVSLIQF